MNTDNPYSIRVVTSLEEFNSLSEKWNCLLEESNIDNIFLTWEWLYTWAKHYLEGNKLWIILIFKGSEPLVGIAPFYIKKIKKYGVLNLRELNFIGTEEVCSSYLDFIIHKKYKKTIIKIIYDYLHKDSCHSWDILTLSELPSESLSIDIWYGLAKEEGKAIDIAGMTSCPVIDLTGTLEDFMFGLSGNERYNLTRKRKRLEQAGNVTYTQATSRDEVEKELKAFIQLHQIRWEGKGLGGSFQSENFRSFHEEIVEIFSEKGWVSLDFLLLNGEKIAGIYGYRYHGRYSFYLPGFNPAILPQASPGILLLFHKIEEAILKGDKEFDMLRGVTHYKMAWATGLRRSLTLRQYGRHINAFAFKSLESCKDLAKILIR